MNNNIDEIKNKVLEILKEESAKFKTFKVITKRADKNFEVKSMDFNNIIGGLGVKKYTFKSRCS